MEMNRHKMADKQGLNYDVRELKLGASFTNNKSSQYHTIKYDFKPASVDVNKMATVDVGTNNQVTVTVPHLDGAGVPQTVFKGNQRPYTKECVLIIDRVTGEITLEKLSSNIQVKKTRQEGTSKPRPHTPAPPPTATDTTQRSSSRTKVATNRRTATAGPGASMSSSQRAAGMVRSPSRQRPDPPQAAPWSGGGMSTLASLPMIGLDDPTPSAHSAPPPATHAPPPHVSHAPPPHTSHAPSHSTHAPPHVSHAPPPATHAPPPVVTNGYTRTHERPLPEHTSMSVAQAEPRSDSSSSSSSDSGSDSDSNSDSDDEQPQPPQQNQTNGGALLRDVLNDDLCLSESGSDSE